MSMDQETSEGVLFGIGGMDEIEIEVAGDTREYLYLSEEDLRDMLSALKQYEDEKGKT